MTITVVTGPPCAGKTTYINDNAEPGDVIIDLDRIALALSVDGTPHHEYPEHVRSVAIAARTAAVDRALMLAGSGVWVWIIHTKPRRSDYAAYRAANAAFVKIDPGIETCLDRATAERPPAVVSLIWDWYARNERPRRRQ